MAWRLSSKLGPLDASYSGACVFRSCAARACAASLTRRTLRSLYEIRRHPPMQLRPVHTHRSRDRLDVTRFRAARTARTKPARQDLRVTWLSGSAEWHVWPLVPSKRVMGG